MVLETLLNWTNSLVKQPRFVVEEVILFQFKTLRRMAALFVKENRCPRNLTAPSGSERNAEPRRGIVHRKIGLHCRGAARKRWR